MSILGNSTIIFVAAIACLVLLLIVNYCRARKEIKALAERNSDELIDNLAEGVYRSSLDGKQLSANPALVRLNGYGSEAEMLKAVDDIATEWYVDSNRRDEFKKLLAENGRVTDFVSEIYRHKTRERIWISENARVVSNPRTGKPLCYEGTVRDITDGIVRK